MSDTVLASSDSLISFSFRNDINITIDFPRNYSSHRTTQIIVFALPNGNSTQLTMGKKMQPGDDWHYDIQHIAAQTKFIRQYSKENIVVVYLENQYKAWPLWKTKHLDYLQIVNALIDTIPSTINVSKYYFHLNGHSGGGAFIFAYLKANNKIPSSIKRISFLDSDYNYDSTYTNKLIHWLKQSSSHHLSVFAYNDSVVVYNGKPLVSPTGGTWYRSKLMMNDLSNVFAFSITRSDSVAQYAAYKNKINFFLIDNPEKKIFHTVQVERNGFIHSVLIDTKYESKDYQYWGKRAYENFIE
jgi:hypothetical protein